MTWIQNNTLKRQNVYDINAFKKCKKWCHNLTYIVVIYIQVICKRIAVGTGISIAFAFCKIHWYNDYFISRLRLWLKHKTLRLTILIKDVMVFKIIQYVKCSLRIIWEALTLHLLRGEKLCPYMTEWAIARLTRIPCLFMHILFKFSFLCKRKNVLISSKTNVNQQMEKMFCGLKHQFLSETHLLILISRFPSLSWS